MKIVVDANILVRAVSDDDNVQSPVARRILAEASIAVLPLVALCEFVWVMRSHYRYGRRALLAALDALLAAPNAMVDRDAVAAGIAFLRAGGDFADGVMAYDGRRLGGEVFATFDVRARRIAADAGYQVGAV